jgi:glutathionylspermidine synthase
MKRLTTAPRVDWQATVEQRGLVWHTAGDRPYWSEGVYYSFSSAEIADIEAATTELYARFLDAGQSIVEDRDAMRIFGIPVWCHDAIRRAWNDEPPALNYGRFDLGYDGKSPPKLFEFNCDTPTSLLEASVIQWDWKEQVFPKLDQFNSLHERLVAKWADIRSYLPGQQLYFTHVADEAGEDSVTAAYLQDTAREAGLSTRTILIDDIGWHSGERLFVDLEEQAIQAIHHLYPWEWLACEAFGKNLIESLPRTIWIEPIWKMMWSNKAILPVLSSMFPDHPNLLGASYDRPSFGRHVAKPFLAREGANIDILDGGRVVASTAGAYGDAGYVYQEQFPLVETAPDTYPVIGSWVVDGVPAGMGIREDGLITGNMARFVPHVIEG